MRINGFFLFCCACVPGAGQMYLGYMKRGLCLISLFCLNLMFCMMLPFLGVFLPVIWMYAFFDSFNLRRQLRTGNFPMDDYLFHPEQDQTLAQLLHARHRLAG